MRSFYKDWSGTSSNQTGPPKLVWSSHPHHQDWPARSRLQDLTGRTIRNPGLLLGYSRYSGTINHKHIFLYAFMIICRFRICMIGVTCTIIPIIIVESDSRGRITWCICYISPKVYRKLYNFQDSTTGSTNPTTKPQHL